jgi:hypothetical protein
MSEESTTRDLVERTRQISIVVVYLDPDQASVAAKRLAEEGE